MGYNPQEYLEYWVSQQYQRERFQVRNYQQFPSSSWEHFCRFMWGWLRNITNFCHVNWEGATPSIPPPPGNGSDNPWKLDIAHENLPSQKENRLPTIIFQGRAVKLRGCIYITINPCNMAYFAGMGYIYIGRGVSTIYALWILQKRTVFFCDAPPPTKHPVGFSGTPQIMWPRAPHTIP